MTQKPENSTIQNPLEGTSKAFLRTSKAFLAPAKSRTMIYLRSNSKEYLGEGTSGRPDEAEKVEEEKISLKDIVKVLKTQYSDGGDDKGYFKVIIKKEVGSEEVWKYH